MRDARWTGDSVTNHPSRITTSRVTNYASRFRANVFQIHFLLYSGVPSDSLCEATSVPGSVYWRLSRGKTRCCARANDQVRELRDVHNRDKRLAYRRP